MTTKPKGVETIFPGGLNAHLGEPRNEREGELATAIADCGLEDVIRNFTRGNSTGGGYNGHGRFTGKDGR